jgi:hypothetical protein
MASGGVGGLPWGGYRPVPADPVGGGGTAAQPRNVPVGAGLSTTLNGLLGGLIGVIGTSDGNSETGDNDCFNTVIEPLEAAGLNPSAFIGFLGSGGTFYDGTQSNVAVAGNVTSTAAANAQYGAGATVSGVFNAAGSTQTVAMTSIMTSTFTTYLNPTYVSGLSAAQQSALLFHEALHGYGGTLGGTSFGDTNLQEIFFGVGSPQVGQASVNISNFIQEHCIK